jgi:hypothetical protein
MKLDRLRELLGTRADVGRTRLLLFGKAGFDPAVTEATRTREDVELIDLPRLYEGD